MHLTLKPLVAATVLALGVLGMACESGPIYAGGAAACRKVPAAARDGSAGLLTEAEFRDRLKDSYKSASTAEPEIRNATAALLRNVTTDGSIQEWGAAIDAMAAACNQYNYPGFK